MKKIISVLLSAILLMSCFSMSAFAYVETDESQQIINDAWEAALGGVAGDANGDGAFNAGDARSTLLYSAGLLSDGFNTAKADLDGDGRVTAIDARLLLRVSAQLEPQDTLYSDAALLNLFNAMANDVKYSSYKFRRAAVGTNIDITTDNQAAIDKFNKQISSLGEDMDLGEMLTESKGTSSYSCTGKSASPSVAADTNYPVEDRDFVSMLTSSDIKSAVYKTGDTFTYTPKRTTGQTVKDEGDVVTVAGLDSLTVYINNEKVTTVPEDTTELSHGKCFDVPQKEDLVSAYDSLDEMLGEMDKMVSELGDNNRFNMAATFKSINYRDSYVKLYFDHDTKTLVGADYNLTYECTIELYMDMYLNIVDKADPLGLFATIDFQNQRINITDTENLATTYYFETNAQPFLPAE